MNSVRISSELLDLRGDVETLKFVGPWSEVKVVPELVSDV